LSRSFQELATGMVQFHNAMKIAYIPLPFPYAQTCDFLLIIHTMIVPIITSQWVTHFAWAFVFTLVQVLVLWSLNLVALEIENPFGQDANDMDGQRMQEEINRHLLLLVDPKTERTPRLSSLFGLRKVSPAMERARTSNFDRVLSAAKRTSIIHHTSDVGCSSNHLESIDQGRVNPDIRVERFSLNSSSCKSEGCGYLQNPPSSGDLEALSQVLEDISPSLVYQCRECNSSLLPCSSDDLPEVCSQCAGSRDVSSCTGSQSEIWWLCRHCQRHVCSACASAHTEQHQGQLSNYSNGSAHAANFTHSLSRQGDGPSSDHCNHLIQCL